MYYAKVGIWYITTFGCSVHPVAIAKFETALEADLNAKSIIALFPNIAGEVTIKECAA